MPVKSLMELASSACMKNIRELESVGDYLPYENVRHILLKVDNAQQLRQIELNSPHIEGETGECWLKIIEREFPMEYRAKAYKPPDPKKWYRVWEKYKKDHDRALEESERKLMSALAGLRQDKEKNTSKIVDRKLLPRAGIHRKPWGGPREGTSNSLTFGRGSRTKTNTGSSVMRKVRREVKEIANIHGSLSRPSRRSGGTASTVQIGKAPAAMVNDHHRAAQPVYRPTPKRVESEAVTEHESRATFISDSEDDGDGYGGGGDDDLFDDDDGDAFDDQPPARQAPAPRSAVRSSATSLLKRPTPSSSMSNSPKKVKTVPSSSTKRSGILSNSYKPATYKTRPASSSTPRDEPSWESSKPTVQTSPQPPPTPRASASSPPPAMSGPSALDVQPKKKKPVSIFMKKKKRV